MIPFDSWDGTSDLSGVTELSKLESYFGSAAVVFGSYQSGIASILELLGSRTHDIPVVMPITTSPDVLAAVLRAGANPFLLDIEDEYCQLDPEILEDVVKELKSAVVILHRPAGLPVNPRLLEVCKDLPTIIDTRLPPSLSMKDDCVGTFTVFDLSPVIGTGSVVVHKYVQQIAELKLIRNGVLGLGANLNEILSIVALKRLKEDPHLEKRKAVQLKVASLYAEHFEESLTTDNYPYFMIEVEDADRVVAFLHGEGISAGKPIFPLHLLPEVSKRWAESPSYPVAEALRNKYVALPVHAGILDKVSFVLSKFDEIDRAIKAE